jgi:hypothetical protein
VRTTKTSGLSTRRSPAPRPACLPQENELVTPRFTHALEATTIIRVLNAARVRALALPSSLPRSSPSLPSHASLSLSVAPPPPPFSLFR